MKTVHLYRFSKIFINPIIYNKMSLNRNVASWFQGTTSSYHGEKLVYPAASRNQEPILQVLQKFISRGAKINDERNCLLLEIAAGSGQHSYHFAPHFPWIKFQPSEYDEDLLGSIAYYATNCPSKNILLPIKLDICNKLSTYGFEENSIDYMYCANMIHISPYKCTIGLFENAGVYLKSGGLLITYGPYKKNGVISPQSNVDFDASLQSRDSSWGLRDINDLEKLAKENNILLLDLIDMPANNTTLIWKKN